MLPSADEAEEDDADQTTCRCSNEMDIQEVEDRVLKVYNVSAGAERAEEIKEGVLNITLNAGENSQQGVSSEKKRPSLNNSVIKRELYWVDSHCNF